MFDDGEGRAPNINSLRRPMRTAEGVDGLYGNVMGGVPMTAKVTVRWTVTVKDSP